jgi:negative regulator of flagellin synthesis FlgM
MQLVGRLSQEVRTATTTGDIQALRQSVASGAYTPDPMAIAARILFLTEEDEA